MKMSMANGEFADFAIEDLRKWGRWELTETILKTAALDTHKKEPMVKRAVLKFMLATSEKNPKAAEFIAVARKENPEKIKEYEEILEQERKTALEASRARGGGDEKETERRRPVTWTGWSAW